MYEYTVPRYRGTRARHCSLRVHRTEVPALLPVLLLTSYMYRMYMCVQVTKFTCSTAVRVAVNSTKYSTSTRVQQ